MGKRSAAIHRKMSMSVRQLPITGSAHKAAVIGDATMAAVLACLDVTAEGCGAAALDRRHDLQLVEAHMAGVGLPPRRPMVAEDIRDLQGGTGHDRRGLCRRRGPLGDQRGETIERAQDRADRVGGDMSVERRRVQLRVAKQNLD